MSKTVTFILNWVFKAQTQNYERYGPQMRPELKTNPLGRERCYLLAFCKEASHCMLE